MKINKLPSWEYLNECFRYESETGELYWKVRPLEHFVDIRSMKSWNSKYVNKKCGSIRNRYLATRILGKGYPNHRIIWKLITKKDPPNFIDHIDGNPLNNKFTNLRKATSSENNKNRRMMKSNTSGYVGVHYCKRTRKYCAQIGNNGRNTNLGYFNTAGEASLAYQEAAKKFHQDFAKF